MQSCLALLLMLRWPYPVHPHTEGNLSVATVPWWPKMSITYTLGVFSKFLYWGGYIKEPTDYLHSLKHTANFFTEKYFESYNAFLRCSLLFCSWLKKYCSEFVIFIYLQMPTKIQQFLSEFRFASVRSSARNICAIFCDLLEIE